jgi:hypothetical protein
MGKRAAPLLASLFFSGALAACVPPAPMAVAGDLPPPATTYSILGDDGVAQAARQPLIDALSARGLRYAAVRPDRFVQITLADRPRVNGTAVGDVVPPTSDAPGWVDRPIKGGWFGKGRREVRLTVRFLSPDGTMLEQRSAYEVVGRKAPAPDVARLVEAALAR